MDDTLAQRTAQASQDLFSGICKALGDHRGVHLETAVAAAGYLTGAAMLKSTDIDLSSLEPGGYVIVEQVNEMGPSILDTVFDLAHRGGLEAADVAAEVPAAHHPHKSMEELLPLVSPALAEVSRKHQIPSNLQPFVAARAVAQLLVAGRAQLPASVLKALAAGAIVRASKTVPPR